MSIASVIARELPWYVSVCNALAGAKQLPDNCLSCICTSPPYFGLRNYGTGRFEGGDSTCDHKGDKRYYTEKTAATSSAGAFSSPGEENARRLKDGRWREGGTCRCGAVWVDEQIGLEETPDEYAVKLVELFRELRRALHPTGSLWLNLGDSYASHPGQRKATDKPGVKKATNEGSVAIGSRSIDGIKAKDLIGIPWFVAFALRADGWYLRQWMPWVKRNPMPESADDRPGTSCEMVFLLSREPDYFFDMEAVKRLAVESNTRDADTRNFRSADLWFDSVGMLLASGLDDTDDPTIVGLDVSLRSYRGAHFAVWPQKLVAPMIQAGTSERGVCPHCFAPHARIVKKTRVPTRPGDDSKVTGDSLTDGNRDPERHVTTTETVGWQPTCKCPEHEPIPAIVYDPFTGSGTTGKVALDLNRSFLGTELNSDYLPLIQKRLRQAKPSLF